ncbi:MAG: DUF3106 domain-containing protein [Burkholderiales bacterium]|nr:DUF3106 domain-containing protein [Burkholderiales bacterium]
MATRALPSSCAMRSITDAASFHGFSFVRCVCACAFAIALAFPALLAAQPASAPVVAKPAADARRLPWASLTAGQQTVLAPLRSEWDGIDAPRKTKWLDVATRYRGLPPEEQKRVQERMVEWARLTPEARGRARLSFQESKQLSREEKQSRWEAYRSLPDDERKALAARSLPATKDKPALSTAADGLPSTAPKRAASASQPVQTVIRPVAPTLVQAKPGATTTPITQAPNRPAHQQPGQPKIAAKPAQVNPTTLLPQTGPQASVQSDQPKRP